MPLPSPKLDDRDFDQLVQAARQYIRQQDSAWTDLGPGDPGMILIEVFAHLTEMLIYRLNKLPDKAYVALLNLLGVQLQAPSAAATLLTFSRVDNSTQALTIPRGTKVAAQRGEAGNEPVVFVTTQTAVIAANTTSIDVLALHCEQVLWEQLDKTNGQAGQRFQVLHAPMIAPIDQEQNIILAVEITEDELKQFEGRIPSVQIESKPFQLWQVVETFAYTSENDRAYMVDRFRGQIMFAPSATDYDDTTPIKQTMAFLPPEGREVRVSYRYGGGDLGNVDAKTLTSLRDSKLSVQVTNQQRASGGRSAEVLSNVIHRAPKKIYALNRAITAQDFETIVLEFSRQIDRVKSINRAALWTHAAPGTVEVLLVPYIPFAQRAEMTITREILTSFENPQILASIAAELEKRRALGTECSVSWARYKPVHIRLRLVVGCEEDREAVKERVLKRLHRYISPLSDDNYKGWSFGETLRASHIYDIALREPGVRWVDSLALMMDEVPNLNVNDIAADPFQNNTWYAASGDSLYRSMNAGQGWELLQQFKGMRVSHILPHPERAGLQALVVQADNLAQVYLSPDCGESWLKPIASFDFEIEDLAWLPVQHQATLLLATDKGLYQVATGATPRLLEVDSNNPAMPLYAVTATQESNGIISVAVSTQARQGIYLSKNSGQANSFRSIGLTNEDIRVLAVQRLGSRSFLWAGAASSGGDNPGTGCYRWELQGREDPPNGWQAFGNRWNGGSCWSLAFIGEKLYAASHRRGVMILHPRDQLAEWGRIDVRAGLPLRDQSSFTPMQTIAADANGILMVGCAEGVFASTDASTTYKNVSEQHFEEFVTLAPNWLFVSGNHEIDIVCEADLVKN